MKLRYYSLLIVVLVSVMMIIGGCLGEDEVDEIKKSFEDSNNTVVLDQDAAIENSINAAVRGIRDNISIKSITEGIPSSNNRKLERDENLDDCITVSASSIIFDNCQVDDCIMDGTMTMTTSVEGSNTVTSYSFDDFNACGNTVNGTLTFTYNLSEGTYDISFGNEGVYTVGVYNISVDSDLTSDDNGNNYDGTIKVDINGNVTYNFTVDNLNIDSTCNIPTSGTMTCNDGENNLTVDFSEITYTTCNDITVPYTYNSVEGSVSLDLD